MRTFLTGVLLLTLLGITSFTNEPATEIRADFKKFYDQYGVEGSFILYDQKRDKYTVYNPQEVNTPFIPASTFKIFNSLVALETGVVQDEHVVFKWDGKERPRPEWNADTDMKAAFKNSTVWYYQELARRTGEERMRLWINKVKYGNADISGGIDGFWLWGGLRISPVQQIGFLKRLHGNNLPFSQRSMNIVKEIMIAKDTSGYVMRAKAGLAKQDNQYIGWYVGYVSTNDNVYYFSNCIHSAKSSTAFAEARLNIAYTILAGLQVIGK